ncbi:hypothetical protein VC83_00752 [Pseudogymnoascus destructans]|uniref:Uncharacterized protein n=1 Tax=Pseudogymnoascus destructans TaxID=655981 RepID=A0A177AK03_9PEZI|nr:uncharacterized protein VC83_00752 [Pseudogymnoascus destructans]OAF62355.1 hypothetical protein VC83_00752 [Pseudogymnoascus destructans]
MDRIDSPKAPQWPHSPLGQCDYVLPEIKGTSGLNNATSLLKQTRFITLHLLLPSAKEIYRSSKQLKPQVRPAGPPALLSLFPESYTTNSISFSSTPAPILSSGPDRLLCPPKYCIIIPALFDNI